MESIIPTVPEDDIFSDDYNGEDDEEYEDEKGGPFQYFKMNSMNH